MGRGTIQAGAKNFVQNAIPGTCHSLSGSPKSSPSGSSNLSATGLTKAQTLATRAWARKHRDFNTFVTTICYGEDANGQSRIPSA
jgi:hypothetical protein